VRIGLLTDSTCDLSVEELSNKNIEIVPLSVHFDDNVYLDRVELSAEEFYELLDKKDIYPRTSQPSVGIFLEKYKKMSESYDAIISIHISSKLSGTFESARLAKSQLSEIKIEVINSKSTSLAQGFLTLLAAKMIKKDYSFEEIVNNIKKIINSFDIYFSVNDLSFLQKGGRIGKVQALLGGILNFNPIIKLDTNEGILLPVEKIRGSKKTEKRVIELVSKSLDDEKYAWIGIVKGNRDISNFTNNLLSFLDNQKYLNYKKRQARISPVLACHAGPSLFGIIIFKGEILKEFF